jgi:hypothetical protein
VSSVQSRCLVCVVGPWTSKRPDLTLRGSCKLGMKWSGPNQVLHAFHDFSMATNLVGKSTTPTFPSSFFLRAMLV